MMPTLAWAPQDLESDGGDAGLSPEIHMDTLLPKAFIESPVLPRALVRVQGTREFRQYISTAPALGRSWGECPHTWQPCVPLRLEEALELGTGRPMAGNTHALRGHLFDPAVGVQQVLGLRAKRQSAGVSGGSGADPEAPWLLRAQGPVFPKKCGQSRKTEGSENSLP